MTALDKYQRLEATALWRAGAEAQRRDVIVSIGDATLTISDLQDRALSHWSLPAVTRANPGERPAIFHPDGDPQETLEVSGDETEMIEAIEKLRKAVAKGRAKPGRLRSYIFLAALAGAVAGMAIWAPGAMRRHTLSVLPEANRHTLGDQFLAQMQRVTGAPCQYEFAQAPLDKLAERYGLRGLYIVTSGVRDTVALPGGVMVMHQSLIEDYEEPDVAGGYIIAELERAEANDPVDQFLSTAGVRATFRLLTTGAVPDDMAQFYIETRVAERNLSVDEAELLRGFATHRTRSTPYAYALDASGETSLHLIEADPFPHLAPDPIISDGDWVALQGICGN